VEDQFARRVAERVVGFLDPDLGLLAGIIHNHVNQNSTAGAGAGAGTVGFGGVDSSPLSSRPPIPIELIEGVIRVLAGMLRPVGIVHPDGVGGFEVLFLQSVEKFPHNVFFAPVAENPSQTNDDHNDGDDQDQALSLS